MTRARPFALAAMALLASCADSHTDTSVRLAVKYDSKWGLTGLVLSVDEKVEPADVKGHFLITLPDAWDGKSIEIELDGMKGDERWAFGKTTVTVAKDQEIKAEIVLARLPCGEWCTEGTTTCSGDGVVTCAQRDDDDCMEWGNAVPCGGDTPYCSLGFCSDSCVDECAKGEVQCAGPAGYQECGNNDSDDCNEWLPVVACDGNQVCSGSVCTDTCQDACDDGDTQCSGAGTATCGDLNGDDCTEWGPIEACGSEQSCTNGECKDGCTDECAETSCSGTTLSQCGQFDFDDCRDLSPGTSCVPADPCNEGQCDETAGCMVTPKVCDDAPEAECTDDDTLRTYSAVGECTAGTCDYVHTDTVCEHGCVDGKCTDASGTCTKSITAVDPTTGIPLGAESRSRSMAFDSTGKLVTSYSNFATGELRLAQLPRSGTWSTSRITYSVIPGLQNFPSTLAVDSSDAVWVAYSNYGLDTLRAVSSTTGSMWSGTNADSAVGVGSDTSMAIDSSGTAWLSYYGGETKTPNYYLKVATKPSGGAWTTTTVDEGDVGVFSSIAVDTAKTVWVSYYDYANGDLKVATKANGGAWSTQAIDTVGSVGAYTSIAIDGTGAVWVSYYDVTNKDLKVATKPSGGAWTKTTVDSADQVGAKTSIAIGKAGAIWIAYDDATNFAVKVARKPKGGAWTTAKVDDSALPSGYASIAVDEDGVAWIGYSGLAPPGGSANGSFRVAKVCP